MFFHPPMFCKNCGLCLQGVTPRCYLPDRLHLWEKDVISRIIRPRPAYKSGGFIEIAVPEKMFCFTYDHLIENEQ